MAKQRDFLRLRPSIHKTFVTHFPYSIVVGFRRFCEGMMDGNEKKDMERNWMNTPKPEEGILRAVSY